MADADHLKVGQEFPSWELFQSALRSYEKKNNVLFHRRDSKLVKRANAGLKKGPFYKAELAVSYCRLNCKYGSTRPSSTKGIRPHQKTFKQNCEASILLGADRKRQVLVVRKLRDNHNHPVESRLFDLYPENRRLEEEHKQKVGERSHLMQQSDKVVSRKDLHNIRASLRGNKTDEARVIDVLDGLLLQDPNSSVALKTTDKGVVTVIAVQTSTMAESYAKFPEVLLMDGTYRTNTNRMPLYTVQVKDGNGKGQTCGYAFIAEESHENIEFLLNHIVQRDREAQKKTRTFVIDKNFTEVKAIKNVFPDTHIVICAFHVSKTFRQEVAKLQCSLEEKERIQVILQQMLHARTAGAYEEAFKSLQKTAPDRLNAYFVANWHSCQCQWVRYLVDADLTLGVTTTNSLESLHQKLKRVVHANMTLADCLQSVIEYYQGQMDNSSVVKSLGDIQKTVDRDPCRQEVVDVPVREPAAELVGVVSSDEVDVQPKMDAAPAKVVDVPVREPSAELVGVVSSDEVDVQPKMDAAQSLPTVWQMSGESVRSASQSDQLMGLKLPLKVRVKGRPKEGKSWSFTRKRKTGTQKGGKAKKTLDVDPWPAHLPPFQNEHQPPRDVTVGSFVVPKADDVKVEAVPVGPVPSQQDEKTSLGEKRLASLINEAVESLNVVVNSLPTRSDAAAQVAQLLSGTGQVFKSLALDSQCDIIDVAANITNITTKWLCGMIHEHVFEAQFDLLQGSLGKHLVLETEPTLEAQELKPDDLKEISMPFEDIIKQTGGVENMDFELSDFKLIEDKAGMDLKIPDLKMLLPLNSEDNIGSFDRNSPFPDSINHDGPTMPLAQDADFLDNLGIQYLPQSGFTEGDVSDLDWDGKLVQGLSTDTFMN